ncbi:unnamed protein product [Lactuca saligna]|uniref:HAT C-terminal dimerisation domain-containing protein n=1 Tax=Lactuca saligna TaxID=75948 RepID=A0AA35VFA8_LACSI|nr:unnamed protein product [Lactuca saligna]
MKGDNFDLLSWWNLNWGKYPILSQIAKDVLGMPISTVSSESAFSTGGRVIDKFRSSLIPKTVEALICTQNWLRSTPSDLQEMTIHGLQLQELMMNLEKLEIGTGLWSGPVFSGPSSCSGLGSTRSGGAFEVYSVTNSPTLSSSSDRRRLHSAHFSLSHFAPAAILTGIITFVLKRLIEDS